MVKSKRNVNEFQKAMLSNTKVIGSSDVTDETAGIISPELLEAFDKLAQKLKIERNDLIEIALEHFLNLEDVWVKK